MTVSPEGGYAIQRRCCKGWTFLKWPVDLLPLRTTNLDLQRFREQRIKARWVTPNKNRLNQSIHQCIAIQVSFFRGHEDKLAFIRSDLDKSVSRNNQTTGLRSTNELKGRSRPPSSQPDIIRTSGYGTLDPQTTG